MSKCGKYWNKVQLLDDEIAGILLKIADLDRHLQSPVPNPALEKQRQALQAKLPELGKKRHAAEVAASECEFREGQKKTSME